MQNRKHRSILQILLRQNTRELEHEISSMKHKCDKVNTTHSFKNIKLKLILSVNYIFQKCKRSVYHSVNLCTL